jgi:phosphoenolpyruvate carboxylase
VFTAHPTFSLSPEAADALVARCRGGAATAAAPPSLRPSPPTLDTEFGRAAAAISTGRDALDRLAAGLFDEARAAWPDRWTELDPRPVLLASWVGYDTDGRTDIGWQDTLRLRLRMKELQLSRFAGQMAAVPEACARPLRDRVETALEAVRAQMAACPGPGEPPPAAVQAFARALVGLRNTAMTTAAPLLALFPEALAAAPDDRARRDLCVARAGLVAHGLSLAHTHTRLNAAQIHNAARLRFPELEGSPDAPARRRALFTAVDEALAAARPEPVDLGGLMDEQASAMRLVMTVAQVAKHVDASQPVRFLIAETESGYTLLAALLLARLCGVEDRVEISPLFETAEALERRGERVIEEALRSSHWRAHLRAVGRLCLQLGYSDSGPLHRADPGQPPNRAAQAAGRRPPRPARLGGPGGRAVRHPRRRPRPRRPPGRPPRALLLPRPAGGARRLRPPRHPHAAGNELPGRRRLPAFQARRPWPAPRSRASPSTPSRRRGDGPPDPVYADESGFAADLFAGARAAMGALVEDRATARCSARSGPALLDRTGSRPAARQSDGGGPPRSATRARCAPSRTTPCSSSSASWPT